MMAYISGFVAAVPTANKDRYLEMAKKVSAVFKASGATRTVENWGVDVPPGKVTSFALATKAKDDETVVFSWIEWPSKEACDAGMAKAMQDPVMNDPTGKDIFDGMRMIFGGFETMLDE